MSQESDLRVKHLEMLEEAITRMANYGATLKNYCITITVGILGFAISEKSVLLLWSSVIPVLIFYLLDAQYLRLEQKFRELFNTVRTADWSSKPDFDMSPSDAHKVSYLSILISWSIIGFYGPLFILILIATAIYAYTK